MLIPDHETAVDFLNYEAISRTAVELLKDNRQRALTLGIHGDWGAGKSSILKMVEAELREEDRVACLWFNGWAFQGFEDAKTVLIEATISELCRQRSGVGRVKEIGARLIKRVNWLKVAKRGGGLAFTLATGLPSPDQIEALLGSLRSLSGEAKSLTGEQIEAGLDEAASFLNPDEGKSVPEEIHEFREEFSKLIEEAEIDQLVVLIDDLDRCLPATAIDTLEAIRLFLFVPKTAFVIGADETMIEYAVRQHFPDLPAASSPMPYVRNYLEKLVQVPFRVPALGSQETKTYVTLLLIEALVGEGHDGFPALLTKARQNLNQPWLGDGISREDVRAVDETRQAELDATYLLAQRIGPILAEGSKGNPRQIKRFLNALLIRQAIAKARGFGAAVNQAVLAKLMLAERFQPDFYEFLAGRVMSAEEGKASELSAMEAQIRRNGKQDEGIAGEDVESWLEREWLQRWCKIEPGLSSIDLRPYVFVARDKRMLAATADLGGLENLIEKLCSSSDMAVRMSESEVKALSAPDADQAFNAVRERVIRHGSFVAEPPGFVGLGIIAKHHPRYQSELVDLVSGVEARSLGAWVVKGWGEVITEPGVRSQLQDQMEAWAAQTGNGMLQQAARGALASQGGGS